MKKPLRLSAYVRMAHLLLALGFLFVTSILGQADSALRGKVTTIAGLPLPDVAVYGSKSCCPGKQEHTITDRDGRFEFEHPQQLFHLQKDGFQPKTVVIESGRSQIDIALEPATGSLAVPQCGRPGAHEKQIGWGKYGLHFNVPVRGVKVRGGIPDVDYVNYAVTLEGSGSNLELWFGIYSANLEPDDDQFIDSVSFSQRLVVNVKGAVIGEDSWGSLRNGGSWRHTAVMGQGAAIYRKADPDDLAFLNQIVNSICEIPSPSR
jgi:hypothetical protein